MSKERLNENRTTLRTIKSQTDREEDISPVNIACIDVETVSSEFSQSSGLSSIHELPTNKIKMFDSADKKLK